MPKRCLRSAVLLALTLASTCLQSVIGQACTEFEETIHLFPELKMSYVMHVHNKTSGQGTLSVRAKLERIGWLGIGFSEDGLMAPSVAIVGLPDEPNSETNPAKYHIRNSYESAMERDPNPALTDAKIRQDDNSTVLLFTIPLIREGEIPIRHDEPNHVIFAYGYTNYFGFHADRDSMSLQFIPCFEDDEDVGDGVGGDEDAQGDEVEEPDQNDAPQTEPPTENVLEAPKESPTVAPTEPKPPEADNDEEVEEEDNGDEADQLAVDLLDPTDTPQPDGPMDDVTEEPTRAPQTKPPADKVTDSPTALPMEPTDPDNENEEKQHEPEHAPSTPPTKATGPEKDDKKHEPEHDVQSCLKFKNGVQLSPLLTLDYVIKQDDNRVVSDYPHGTISAKLTYEGLGWIGFGVTNTSGSMVPAEVIIGLPSQPVGLTANPGKYALNGRGRSTVMPFPRESQTLINSTISQTDSMTILTFHKHLVEPGELPINANGQTTFIWAYGSSNELITHADRGAFNLTLYPCDGNPTSSNQDNGNVVTVQTSGQYKSIWTAHGVFAGIAWGIMVPLAVASTLLRDLFPNQKRAINVHITLNSLASLFTLIAFILAVVGRQKSTAEGESPNHFAVVAHRSIGLVIMIFTTFQVVAAVCRPKKYQRTRIPDDVETSMTSFTSKFVVQKSKARKVWQIFHKIIGFAMVCIAWLQIYSGLTLYSKYFDTKHDFRFGFCVAVVVIALTTLLLSIYSIRSKRRSTVPLTVSF